MPDEPASDAERDQPHPERGLRGADLKRAIAIAEKSSLKSYRIEIAPDGTISIVVGDRMQGDD